MGCIDICRCTGPTIYYTSAHRHIQHTSLFVITIKQWYTRLSIIPTCLFQIIVINLMLDYCRKRLGGVNASFELFGARICKNINLRQRRLEADFETHYVELSFYSVVVTHLKFQGLFFEILCPAHIYSCAFFQVNKSEAQRCVCC